MSGYLALCAAMALDAVDTLSDEERPQDPPPPAPKGAPKTKAKAKGAPKEKKTVTPKKGAPVPKAKTKADQESGASAAFKKPACKRPAADSSSSTIMKDGEKPPPEKVLVSKGRYKDGKYGFKINGSEKLRVTCCNQTSIAC